jgi:hypothetical protein
VFGEQKTAAIPKIIISKKSPFFSLLIILFSSFNGAFPFSVFRFFFLYLKLSNLMGFLVNFIRFQEKDVEQLDKSYIYDVLLSLAR